MKFKHDRFKLSLSMAKWMALPLMFLFIGCGEGQDPASTGDAGAMSETMDEEGMMPARRQKAINFDGDALHSLDKAVGYSTTELQAVNLGIYAGDLSYSVIFNQNQQSVDYLNTCRRLCDGLGVGDLIDADLIARADNNRSIRDSLVDIVTETFYALNARFRENGMEEVGGLMAAGGWIEGVYLGTLSLNTSTEDLKLRIAEQKMTLDNLMGLLNSYAPTPALTAMKEALAPVEAAFAGVRITENQAAATAASDGTVIISGGPEVSYDQATLAVISETIAAVRNQYAQ
jgi:hypothetical protein